MAWEKVKVFELARVDSQLDDLVQSIGGRSGPSGVGTPEVNPLVDSMVWDSAVFGISTLLIGGSFSVDVMTTINGVTFPVARSVNTVAGRAIMTNLLNSPWVPNPTQIAWDETAAGGITASVIGILKTDRGALKGAGNNSKKVVIGKIISTIGDLAATATKPNGVTNADRFMALSVNPSGASFGTQLASTAGSQQYDLWDSGGFFMHVTGVCGTYNVSLLSTIDGQTYTTATFPAVSGITRVAAVNATFGAMPRPTHILFDAPSAGAAIGLTADVYFVGKGTRGRRFGY